MKSVMSHNFSQVPKAEIQRSKFNRDHGLKTTFDAGWLVPIFFDQALPGDTFTLNATTFTRLQTPIVPFMDNVFLDVFFFAVPHRLVWDNWQKFNGEQTNPGDSTDYLIPQMTAPVGGYNVGSIYDYYGLPTGVAGYSHSALPLRAYNLIYDEWFRDQNLQDSLTTPKDDGPDAFGDYALMRRGKRHDYFTSCLPWPQKGPAIELPLGDSAPVITDGTNITMVGNGGQYTLNSKNNAGVGYFPHNDNTNMAATQFGSNTGLEADLSDATAATINSLRQAFQLQRLYERDARGGTRYTEIIKAHFGVTSPDARLQRPEYLGGGSVRVNINPVAQTSSTDSETPQGNLAAFGTASGNGIGFSKSFTEHCIIIGLVSARADLNYQQGLDRQWSWQTRWDFPWPALMHIGEQAVLTKEIYCTGDPNIDEDVFGYQERYAECRYKKSMVTGKFRSTASGTLDIWHLAQRFTTQPILDEAFIVENPPLDRVIAVPDEPHFLSDWFFQLTCARPMPTYSVPGLIDHF